MRRLLILIACLTGLVALATAQQSDTTKPAADTMKAAQMESQAEPAPTYQNPYYGGYVGGQFGDYSSIIVSPMVGWHFTPVLSGGLRFEYEYAWVESWNASNYGGSAFAIARVHPRAFLQAEFKYMSYEYPTIGTREWVPFLYLGGGYVQQLGANTSLVASVMVDVLQDDNSPYEDWTPTFSIGIVAGF